MLAGSDVAEAALYLARFGVFLAAPIQQFADDLAGEHIDLDDVGQALAAWVDLGKPYPRGRPGNQNPDAA